MTPEKHTVFDWIDQNRARLSDHHLTIWNFAEPAWREYRSAGFYVDLLRKEGFDVEAGSATMPTAFCAKWGRGKPNLGAYAEYDAVPGMSQAPVPYRKPRDGFHKWATGHTDPTFVDLATTPSELARARAEFVERTGGGIGGSRWVAPLLPKDFRAPVHYRWPEYVTTVRGEE